MKFGSDESVAASFDVKYTMKIYSVPLRVHGAGATGIAS